MRIVLDMQGAQTKSRFRGIGRYTMSLAKAIVRNRGKHEIIIALNGLFPDTIEPIRAAFDGLLPQENIRVWYAPGPVRECQPGNEWRREVAERIREAFLARLRPDIVHIFSLFEGYVDDGVTSIGVFDTVTPVTVTLYDLIPLVYNEHYIDANPGYKQYYLRKIDYLKRASLLLAISNSSRREVLEHLGFPEDRVINVSTAVSDMFRPLYITKEEAHRLRIKFGIMKPFVLYVGGVDYRKNIKGLIRGWSRLSETLRNTYCLVLAGAMNDSEKKGIEDLANQCKLGSEEIVFLGYVTDEELVWLYNLCEILVCPSIHEGFGLPVLEAMACGAAVIASNTTSIPEVMEREDALFDPHDDEDIANKLEKVLTDEDFRIELKNHGLRQSKKFSWDESAKRVIASFETLYAGKKFKPLPSIIKNKGRPKMAYISPLPPEKSGISYYSAELLPELVNYYDIEVIVNQKDVSENWIKSNLPIRTVEWFQENAFRYDRVLYHFGNSPFHSHMFGLLREFPGVVVLHDFFLGNVLAYDEIIRSIPWMWTNALYESHGYLAVKMRFSDNEMEKAKIHYPANLRILQQALGIIVHSEFSKKLAEKYYGNGAGRDWVVIPHLRVPVTDLDRLKARRQLNIAEDMFLVCSFGILGPTKLNHRLLEAWLDSSLSKDERCNLVFVGENHGGEYGGKLLKMIKNSGVEGRIRITGWVDHYIFRQYLAAADVAVQLRTNSRGETSGTVLDCMNYGLATIVNAHGSLAELARDSVWMLPDEFTNDELVEALETLRKDESLRMHLGDNARKLVLSNHNPAKCAELYRNAIETFYDRAKVGKHVLIDSIADVTISEIGEAPDDTELINIAKAISRSFTVEPSVRQLLVDVSEVVRVDLKTGIERVVRAQLLELLQNQPNGFRVEPVYLVEENGQWFYRYARKYTCNLLGIKQAWSYDEPVDVAQGDIFYAPDFFRDGITNAVGAGMFLDWKLLGVSINFLIYDILPILRPEFFPEGSDIAHTSWLASISRVADRLICISKFVANEVGLWLEHKCPSRLKDLEIYVTPLGADIESSVPTKGLPRSAKKILKSLERDITFLMVGTIEPRKGHLQVISAFDRLWDEGYKINLVIVGKEGWKPLPEHQRRTIPRIVSVIRNHRALGKRLFWLEGISDEYLEKVYKVSSCLIAASEAEGFGLPLIEAAQHRLPIIARDIPVFREVAGDHAFYFKGDKPESLAEAIKEWLALYRDNRHPKSDNMPWFTWKESTKMLLDILLGVEKPYLVVKPNLKDYQSNRVKCYDKMCSL